MTEDKRPNETALKNTRGVKLLGVHLTDSLSMDEHVRQCGRGFKTQGLPLNCLNLIHLLCLG